MVNSGDAGGGIGGTRVGDQLQRRLGLGHRRPRRHAGHGPEEQRGLHLTRARTSWTSTTSTRRASTPFAQGGPTTMTSRAKRLRTRRRSPSSSVPGSPPPATRADGKLTLTTTAKVYSPKAKHLGRPVGGEGLADAEGPWLLDLDLGQVRHGHQHRQGQPVRRPQDRHTTGCRSVRLPSVWAVAFGSVPRQVTSEAAQRCVPRCGHEALPHGRRRSRAGRRRECSAWWPGSPTTLRASRASVACSSWAPSSSPCAPSDAAGPGRRTGAEPLASQR